MLVAQESILIPEIVREGKANAIPIRVVANDQALQTIVTHAFNSHGAFDVIKDGSPVYILKLDRDKDDRIAYILQKATPLVFSGLAVALALRVGLFNIGAEGQLAWGAIGAAIVGVSFASLPAILLVPLCAITGVVLGGVWGAIAGLLKATRGVHEVISTIMLNFIATGLVAFLLSPDRLATVDDAGKVAVRPGAYRLIAGGSSPGLRSTALGAATPVETTINVIQ